MGLIQQCTVFEQFPIIILGTGKKTKIKIEILYTYIIYPTALFFSTVTTNEKEKCKFEI